MSEAKQTALITGGAKGIGGATTRMFAQNGYRVAIHYLHSEERARALREEIRAQGGQAECFCADITRSDEVRAMFAAVRSAFGPVDVLVNNAGIAQQKLFTEISGEEWHRMFAVHVDGMFYCCRCALPDMIHRKSGRIVNVSSMWGVTGGSCEVHYSAAKAAVIGFTKALAKELGPSNIRVNCVAPGVIETDMLSPLSAADKRELAEETPLMRLGTPEDVANAILFLAGPRSGFFTGQVLSPNGGIVI